MDVAPPAGRHAPSKRLTSAILLAGGVFALAGAFIGYSGMYARLTADSDGGLKEEIYAVVDAAQLWFCRPVLRGGGGRSFAGLSCAALGLPADTAGGYNGRWGRYWLVNLTPDSFDLAIDINGGRKVELGRISFDTRLDLRQALRQSQALPTANN